MIPKLCLQSLLSVWSLSFALIAVGVTQRPLSGQELSRWIDSETVAVVRIDVESLLRSVSPQKVQQLLEQAGLQPDQTAPVLAIGQRMNDLGQQFLQAGGAHVWIVLSLADIPSGSPLIVVRGSAGRDVSRLMPWLVSQREPLGIKGLQLAKHDDLTCLVAHPNTLKRATQIVPDERPDLATALMAAGKGPVCAVLVPSRDQRRVIRETFPTLPEPWQGVSGELIADEILWSALALSSGEDAALRLILQARDASTAGKIADLTRRALHFVSELPEVKQRVPQVASLTRLLEPEIVGTQVQIPLRQEMLQAPVLRVLTEPMTAARQAARRQVCINNMKQIGLAMHNYHARHKSLPPAASRDDEGKLLLSWRVHVLPYLGQNALYGQFHLDEPWDSQHNRQLIALMPKVFVCPSAAGLERGKTTYVLPIGPGTVWGGEQPLSLREITDGTSQTAMVVEAAAEKAVFWTQPADIPIEPEAPSAGLGTYHGHGYLVQYCDGSVRLLSADLSAESLWGCFGATDGKVIRE